MRLPGNRLALAGLWLLLTVLSATLSVQQWRAGVPLDADLFSLLPADARDPVVNRAYHAAESALNRTVLVWVAPPQDRQPGDDVSRIAARLRASGLFSAVLTGSQGLDSEHLKPLLHWRFNLLPPAMVDQLRSDNGSQRFLDAYLQRLMSPVGLGPIPLEQDVFGITNQWLQQLPMNGPAVDPATGLWSGDINGKRGAFLVLINEADAFTLNVPEQIASLLSQIRSEEASRGVEVLASGAALFAASAASQAKAEISTVGIGSAIAALLLILWVFRSPRGWLTLLPVAYGSWLALLACDLLFGQVHLMTLVFGSSLTGVSIDYALHVMADAFQSRGQWSASAAVRKLLPGLTLGMITSVMSYACLGLAPFPGLQQVAVFSGVSLLSAYLMVILLFPLLLSGFQRSHQPLLLKWLTRLLRVRDRVLPARRVVFAVSALLAIGGMLQLNANDDIRQLYASDPTLQQVDQQLRRAFALDHNSQFILVRAADEAQLLAREQRVLHALDALQADKRPSSYSALSQWIPDESTQRAHRDLLARRIFAPESPVQRQLLALGFSEEALAQQWQAFAEGREMTLGIDEALSLPVAAPWRPLWLGQVPDGVASRISLRGAPDIRAIESAIQGIEGTQLVDRVADISRLLGQYRGYTGNLIALALFVTWALLIPRYGARRALRVVAAPTLAIVLTVGLHGWLNLTFNLFSLFGFLIVLGMGVDYAIYFEEAQHHADPQNDPLPNIALGITLDALTTLFSFGLLSVSSTPAVSAFGTSVLLGIAFSWLFAHLVGRRTTQASFPPDSPGVSP